MRAAVSSVIAGCAAVLVTSLAGCGSGGFVEGSQSAGREVFIQRCGSCHTLTEAGTRGTIGPNLDDAFAQAREDGMTAATFTQVVAGQVRYPIEDPSTDAQGMPGPDGPQGTLPECGDVDEGAFCVDDQDDAIDNVAAYVAAVAGTGAEPPTEPAGGGGEATDGRAIFVQNCAACHTLADAGTSGTIGPNLDQARPSKELAVDRVTNGMGAMPPFKDSLSPAQIEAVAEYVSSSAGR